VRVKCLTAWGYRRVWKARSPLSRAANASGWPLRARFLCDRVLLADEPTGNLDEVTGAQVGALMNELNRELGMTLVVVTHNRELAAGMGRTLELKAGTLYEKIFE